MSAVVPISKFLAAAAEWIGKNKPAYDFCRHYKLCTLGGKKTTNCPAEISEEIFDEKDANGKGWGLTPGDIGKLVEFGFVKDSE